MGNKIYVGIDLGTTNTLVSYKGKKGITTLKFLNSGNVLPSVLYLDPDTKEIKIGKDAYMEGLTAPESRIMSAKTYMGREKRYELPVNDGEAVSMTPTDVAAEVLKAVKARIIKKLKLAEDDEICAVITVPAAFSPAQKEETKKAAKMAGLNCIGLKPEPVAAAIAGAEGIAANCMVFVVDIGGGTYDTAVVSLDEDLNPEIVSQEGDRELGGNDFDKIIYDYLLEKVGDDIGADLSEEGNSDLSREDYLIITSEIYTRSKEVKEELSRSEECYAKFDKFIIEGYNNNEPVHLSYKITRERFNLLCTDIYKKIEERLDKSIVEFRKTGHDLKEITHLVLVGGSCYIPAVIEMCERKIGITSSMQCDKTTAVAEGAGIIADSWTAVGENTSKLKGKDIGGIIAQSMGVAETGGIFSKIIEKGTHYPVERSRKYTTTYDNQESVKIAIYYASPDKEDYKKVVDHEYYGYFILDNIKKAKKGVPQIEVTFDFDSDEQLTVTAKDLDTKSTKTIKVEREYWEEEEMQSGKPMAIDLLIDCSGSMRGEPLNDAKNACRKMISEIADLSVHKMGITAFESTPTSICGITSDKDELLNSVGKMQAWGGTGMKAGIESSYNKLLASDKEEKIIFLMTDGAPNGGDRSESFASEIRQKGNVRLAVIFIGTPNSRGFDFSQNVAKANAIDGETPLFYTSKSMSELGAIFKKVYTDIISVD